MPAGQPPYLTRLPCGHHYHQRCIEDVMLMRRACPLCSKDIGLMMWEHMEERKKQQSQAGREGKPEEEEEEKHSLARRQEEESEDELAYPNLSVIVLKQLKDVLKIGGHSGASA